MIYRFALKLLALLLSGFLIVSCSVRGNSPFLLKEADENYFRYQECMKSSAPSSTCYKYWEASSASREFSSLKSSGLNVDSQSINEGGLSKATGALLMGIICSASSNPSACVTGAAERANEGYTAKSADSKQEKRMKELEDRSKKLEQSVRNQCLLKGGIYNPVIGCNK